MKVTILKGLPFSQKLITGQNQTVHYPPFHEPVELVFEIIREEKLKPKIDELRKYYTSNKTEYDRLKKELPICLFSGTFSAFANDKLIVPSNLIVVDFDKLSDRLEVDKLKNKYKNDPYTFSVFDSPSGLGLKLVVKVDNNADNKTHNEHLQALKEYYNSPYWDDNHKGICRACFLSADKNIYVNLNSRTWSKRMITPLTITSNQNTQTVKAVIPNTEIGKYIGFLEGGWSKYPMNSGNRHNSTFFRSREMAEWNIPEDDAYDYLSQYITPDFPDAELKRQISKAYQKTKANNKIGIKYRKI